MNYYPLYKSHLMLYVFVVMKEQTFKNIFKLLFISSCLFISLSTIANTKNNKFKAHLKTPITVFTTPTQYQYYNDKGKLVGCSIDIIKSLFAKTKDPFAIKMMPWARAYANVIHTNNVMIFSLARTKIRESKFNWIGKLVTHKNSFWGLKNKYPKIPISVTELKSVQIAVIRNSSNDQILTEHGEYNLYKVATINQSIKMLLSHRVSLINESKVNLQARFKTLGYDFSKIVAVYELPELIYDLYVAMNVNSDPQLVRRYKHAYQQLVDNGTVEKIINQCAK